MKRRDFLAGMFAGTAISAGSGLLWRHLPHHSAGRIELKTAQPQAIPLDNTKTPSSIVSIDAQAETLRTENTGSAELPVQELARQERTAAQMAFQGESLFDGEMPVASPDVNDPLNVLKKVRYFDSDFNDDIILPAADVTLLHKVFQRLNRSQSLVGHGNFNLLGFDQMLAYAKRYSQVGEFDLAETEFLERIFFTNASDYGFYGEKVESNLTSKITKKDVYKVPYSGHYIFKGKAFDHYKQLRTDIGDKIILTSGIRSNVKQMHLFLAKAVSVNYNLSRASRSLAPPGHSFHGVGDFDVGRVGWGMRNFTDKFSQTDEYKRMQDLGYVKIRYTRDNQLGVRFEPWHIKVV